MSRRTFIAAAAAGAVAGAALRPAGARAAAKLEELPPGIKVSLQVPGNPGEDDLRFARQLGVEYVSIPSGRDRATLENFVRWRERVEAAGLKVWNIGNSNVHNMPEVTLNLPGRDQKIEEYKTYLRNLAKAGIHYTTYAHMGNGIWSSERETTRGGAPARAFRLETAKGYWTDKVFTGPLTHGRVYSKEEIWENYGYFIKQVVPVAEELGIRIGIHPDDPPVPELGGIPRCIFGCFDGYVRALEIADSPNVGVCLCCGTWLEGGKAMGKDVLEAIRAFAALGKLWKIHFRNVTAPVPHFVETFVDNGMMDMWKVMKALREVDFRGALIADHVPEMVGGRNVGWAYSIGYIRALLARANAEAGGG
ncbi:MAG: mannonate dehydratase [Planctomycetes bacterium]|nr:mannonate dehydratase [Planctomycetota bacterium]